MCVGDPMRTAECASLGTRALKGLERTAYCLSEQESCDAAIDQCSKSLMIIPRVSVVEDSR